MALAPATISCRLQYNGKIMVCIILFRAGSLLTVGALPLYAGRGSDARRDRNRVIVCSQTQHVYYYPGSANTSRAGGKILFAPGDGLWRGFAITIAERMAAWGFDGYGLDTKQYLESFTGKTVLKESDVMADFRQIAEWLAAQKGDVVKLIG